MFSKNELVRYSRHFSLHDFGGVGQFKLKQARVLCIGCGGLAATAVVYLAAAGIGCIGLVDDDVVDESNLQRQVLFKTSEVGEKKVKVLATRILELNPHVQVESYDTRVNDSNALELISKFDIILDCTDNFYTKYLINDACCEVKKPFVYGSVFHFEGQVSFFSGVDQSCLRCLFPAPPDAGMVSNCAEEGVLGVLPGLIGTIQAVEVIKYLVGLGDNLKGRLFFLNTLTMSGQTFEFSPAASCPICQGKKRFHELNRPGVQHCTTEALATISAKDLSQILDQVTLIDVREEFERKICNIGGIFAPLSQFELAIKDLDRGKKMVTYCKSGKRSQAALQILREHHFKDVASLEGGILSWIDNIDPSLQRY
jgi:molybdopterin/thiamine biosynthesis adenylyltransferase/rhodanese-related sulfurtransferase